MMMLAVGYLFGSIPFGVILTRLGGAGDVRAIGSGNIGATNVLRTGRKGLAAGTLILDMAKGLAAVWIAQSISPDDAIIAGAGAILGHLYPIWLKFHGGKGVATYMGVALALDWRIGAIYALLWIGVIVIGRISSLGGLVAAVSVPVAAWALGHPYWLPLLSALTLLVLWRHKENIGRLLSGREPRIGKGSDAADNAG
ncbi:glycerol-3-phosphate 1-O-acyltransferase PlsY [Sphingomonas lacunae]